MPDARYAPLHIHSDVSFLDSMSRPKALVERAKELGYPAVAVTDHGSVHGFVRIFQECKKAGVKMIPGCEVYFADRKDDVEAKNGHLTILAENQAGLSNLYKMVTWSNIPVAKGGGFHKYPRVSWDDFEKYRDGLICLTGCMLSPVNQAFLSGGYEAGREVAAKLMSIFGKGNFFVELQNANDEDCEYVPEHVTLLRMGRRLARDLGVKAVATNDSHYVSVEDEEAHEVLRCIGTGTTLNHAVGPGGRLKLDGHSYHLQSADEMLRRFSEEEVVNTLEVAGRCSAAIDIGGKRMPKFDPSMSEEECFELLKEKVREGWRFWKIGGRRNVEEYKKRVNVEMGDIREAGLTDYFLIVWDVTRFIEDKGIGRGFSRGSAGGSLVSYLLRITLTDPVEHGLIWERFWNRGRKGSMPDIDMDVATERRDEVIEYLRGKFGKNRVFPMMTISKMTAKQAVKDAGRAVGLPYNYMNALCKKFPHKCKSIDDAVARSPEIASASKGEDSDVSSWESEMEALKKRWKAIKAGGGARDYDIEGQVIEIGNRVAERKRKLIKVFRVARRLENVARQRSKHACAILIHDSPVFGKVPLTWDAKSKSLVTGFDMYDLETIGCLKLDVLGLANASMVGRLLPRGVYEVIEKGFEDPAVYDLVCSGNCKGVFQLESHLGRNWARRMKPRDLGELAALLSIVRPAVLETGLADQYLKNRSTGKYEVMHEDLRSIFDSTHGIMLYQEQMLEVVKKFAGFDLAHADNVRKACGKKKPEEMAKHRKDFVDGCLGNGYSQAVADKLWEWIEASAGYSFNASHAFGYAMMTYTTAWLKRYKTLDFFNTLLRLSDFSPKPKDEIREIFYDAKLFGVEVSGPSTRLGNEDFEIDGGKIRFGLKHVRGIGEATVAKLKGIGAMSWEAALLNEERPSKSVMQALIRSGAFDHVGQPRMQLERSVDFVESLTDREISMLRSLLITGEPVQFTHGKEFHAGKVDGLVEAIERLASFLEKDNPASKIINKNRAEKMFSACAEFLSQDASTEFDIRTKAGYETFYLGIPATCSEADAYGDARKTHDCLGVKKARENSEVVTVATIMDVNKRRTRKDTDMAFIKIADGTYMCEVIAFSEVLTKNGGKMEQGKTLLFKGVKRRGSVILDGVEEL